MPDLRQQIRAHYEAQTLSAEKVEAILARGRAAADGEEVAPPSAKVVPFSPARRRWISALSIAAGVALFAGLVVWLLPRNDPSVSFAMLAPRVVEFFGGDPKLPKKSQDHAVLREWLIAHGAPPDFEIPKSLLPLESFACDVLKVQGQPAYLACFWREKKPDGSGGELVHLVVTRRVDFRDAPDSAQPRWRELDGWSFASWADGGLVYTLAAAAPPAALKPFLNAGSQSLRRPVALAAFSF